MKTDLSPSASAIKKGFTLIEILVVIAIISLLSAILFPALGRVRENARRSSCQSNLKQIGLSITQYAQDYDEMIPSVEYNGTPLSMVLQPYLKNYQVWRCPSDTTNKQANARTYALNVRLGNTRLMGQTITSPLDWQVGTGQIGLHMARIPSPSTTILLGERPNNNSVVTGTSGSDMACPDNPGGAGQGTGSCRVGSITTYGAEQTINMASGFGSTPNHFEGWNYAFADGHVKWLLPLATIGKTGGAYCTGTPFIASPCGMWTEDPNDD